MNEIAVGAGGLPAGVRPATIPGAFEFDMRSAESGLSYRIYVRAPTERPPSRGYPIVYVTDGNVFFATAAIHAEMMEEGGEVEPAVIVGIGYPLDSAREPDIRRLRDLTWSEPTGDVRADYAMYLDSKDISYGGADGYYRFIREEVEPSLAKSYHIDRGSRTIFGYSLGGLFALYLLFRHPAGFRNYVAGSPSIWWNDRSILREVPSFRQIVEAGTASPRVLITVGALEQSINAMRPPRGMSRARFEEAVRKAKMVDNARELGSTLRAIEGEKEYRVESHIFEGETHQSVVGATISRALRFSLKS